MNRFLLCITTALSFAALYSPQPILPLFASEFNISRVAAGGLITLALLPLSIAPLWCGYALQRFASYKLLSSALLGLALLQFVFTLSSSPNALLIIRALQGLCFPIIFTSLMATAAQPRKGEPHSRSSIALYVASTITGGGLGRLVAGVCSSYFGWRIFFRLLCAALLCCVPFVLRWEKMHQGSLGTPLHRPLHQLVCSLRASHGVALVFVKVFLLFLVFAAAMNFIPFRLKELYPQSDEMSAGFLYIGYGAGIASSLLSPFLISRVGRPAFLVIGGFGSMMIALLLMFVESWLALSAGVFILCGAMFGTHAVAASWVNSLLPQNRQVVNGLYVSFYYSGGVLGSYAPGYLYEFAGWNAFLAALLVCCAAAIALALYVDVAIRSVSEEDSTGLDGTIEVARRRIA